MAVSNNTFRNFSFHESHETRREEADFRIPNHIESLWNSLEPSIIRPDGTATTGSTTNIYGYSRDGRREKSQENDYRNQMINLPELLVCQDMDAYVLQYEHVPLSGHIGNNVESHADSDKMRREEADFYISNHIESLRNSSKSHIIRPDSTATIDCKTNVYGYNRDSQREKNDEEDYRNQMIDLPELLVYHDMDANALRDEHVPLSGYIGNNVESYAYLDETRGEGADFHISNQIESLRNTLDLYGSTASPGSETNICGYNRDGRREKSQENDYRNQMIDLSELLHHDMDANAPRVEHVPPSDYRGKSVEPHADSVATGNTCNIVEDAKKKYKLTTSCNRRKHSDLMKRYCPKCKKLVVGAKVYKKQLCAVCKTLLSYQCARCDKQYSVYDSLVGHLDSKCNTQNLDLKCPVCEYRTHSKIPMRKHLVYCLSGISFSCGFCEHTSKRKEHLLTHMTAVHKDILKIDCSQCKTKTNKCKQCKNKVTICGTCRKGLSSTDKFQEHQKSCKQPVLECKYCPYKTTEDKSLKSHIRLEHLSALSRC